MINATIFLWLVLHAASFILSEASCQWRGGHSCSGVVTFQCGQYVKTILSVCKKRACSPGKYCPGDGFEHSCGAGTEQCGCAGYDSATNQGYGTCQDPQHPTFSPTVVPTSLFEASPLEAQFSVEVYAAKSSSYGYVYALYIFGCSLIFYAIGALKLLKILEDADEVQKVYDENESRPPLMQSECSLVKELFDNGEWSAPAKDRFGKVPYYLSSSQLTDLYTCLCHNHPYISCAFFFPNRVSLAFEQSVSLLLTAFNVATMLINVDSYLVLAINLCIVPAMAPSIAGVAYIACISGLTVIVLISMLGVISIACYYSMGDNHYGVLYDYLMTAALVSFLTELFDVCLKCVSDRFFRITLFPCLRSFVLDVCGHDLADVLTGRLILISVGHRFIEQSIWTGKSFEIDIIDASCRTWFVDVELLYRRSRDRTAELSHVNVKINSDASIQEILESGDFRDPDVEPEDSEKEDSEEEDSEEEDSEEEDSEEGDLEEEDDDA